MISNDIYLKILPGKKLNTLESLGDDLYIDAILCDGDNAKIAALSKDYPITGLDKDSVQVDIDFDSQVDCLSVKTDKLIKEVTIDFF